MRSPGLVHDDGKPTYGICGRGCGSPAGRMPQAVGTAAVSSAPRAPVGRDWVIKESEFGPAASLPARHSDEGSGSVGIRHGILTGLRETILRDPQAKDPTARLTLWVRIPGCANVAASNVPFLTTAHSATQDAAAA